MFWFRYDSQGFDQALQSSSLNNHNHTETKEVFSSMNSTISTCLDTSLQMINDTNVMKNEFNSKLSNIETSSINNNVIRLSQTV